LLKKAKTTAGAPPLAPFQGAQAAHSAGGDGHPN